MSAHTPGPWFWSQGVDDWELVGADANRVLFCWNDSTKWKSGLIVGKNIKEADARLIAAAPDMYDALKAVIDVLQEWHEDLPEHVGDKEPAVMEKARAALAKASQ